MGFYAKLIPIGIGLALSATFFLLGILFANAPYTYNTLWSIPNDADFEASLHHYRRWAALPWWIFAIPGAATAIGLFGFLVLLYKPKPTLRLYDYVSGGMFFLSICVFLTNVRTGVEACVHGKWGEVDMPTGINVIAASETMMVVLLFGAGFMQAGRYYQIIEDEKSDVEYAKLVAKAEEEEKLAEEARKEEEEKQAKKDARNAKKYGHDEGTTGSEVTETTARKTKTKKT